MLRGLASGHKAGLMAWIFLCLHSDVSKWKSILALRTKVVICERDWDKGRNHLFRVGLIILNTNQKITKLQTQITGKIWKKSLAFLLFFSAHIKQERIQSPNKGKAISSDRKKYSCWEHFFPWHFCPLPLQYVSAGFFNGMRRNQFGSQETQYSLQR